MRLSFTIFYKKILLSFLLMLTCIGCFAQEPISGLALLHGDNNGTFLTNMYQWINGYAGYKFIVVAHPYDKVGGIPLNFCGAKGIADNGQVIFHDGNGSARILTVSPTEPGNITLLGADWAPAISKNWQDMLNWAFVTKEGHIVQYAAGALAVDNKVILQRGDVLSNGYTVDAINDNGFLDYPAGVDSRKLDGPFYVDIFASSDIKQSKEFWLLNGITIMDKPPASLINQPSELKSWNDRHQYVTSAQVKGDFTTVLEDQMASSCCLRTNRHN